jgi:hypothetical protein
MITLKPWHVSVEWIYTAGQKAIDAYPDLAEDLEEVRKRLDAFGKSPTPQNRLKHEQVAQPFISKSLRAFANDFVEQVDWEFLSDEFRTAKDPKLTDIARLFSEPDTIENRAVILLHIWKRIRELAEFKPKELPVHIWPFLAELPPPSPQPEVPYSEKEPT